MFANEWVTVERMSERTGLPIPTIRFWIRQGKLRATTLDNGTRRMFVDIAHFNATLESRLREEVAYEGNLK